MSIFKPSGCVYRSNNLRYYNRLDLNFFSMEDSQEKDDSNSTNKLDKKTIVQQLDF